MNIGSENYIKLIYEISLKNDFSYVKTNELAEYFGYTTQSVIEMIRKLVSGDLVEYVPYQGVRITETGRKEATRIIRRHRLWELFLCRTLKMDWSAVHDEAEKLEHATSEEVIDRLEEFLGFPKTCPHGNPIPDKRGFLSETSYTSLFDCQEGEKAIIVRVVDTKPLLAFLNKERLNLNESVIVREKDDYNQNMIIETGNKKIITVGYQASRAIYVSKEI